MKRTCSSCRPVGVIILDSYLRRVAALSLGRSLMALTRHYYERCSNQRANDDCTNGKTTTASWCSQAPPYITTTPWRIGLLLTVALAAHFIVQSCHAWIAARFPFLIQNSAWRCLDSGCRAFDMRDRSL